MSDLLTLVAEPWPDYGLIDSGHGRKLESAPASILNEVLAKLIPIFE